MIPILGRDIRLFLVNDSSAIVPIGCARTVRLKASRVMLETSDSTTGRFKKYIAGMIDQGLSVSGLVGYSNGSQYDALDIYKKILASGTNLINFDYKIVTSTYIYTLSGQCIVSGMEHSRQYNDAAAYDVDLTISGEVTITQTGTFLPYFWLTSSTQLTADQVVTLIEAGSSTSVTAPSYSTITINFAAPGGKWLYFAYPATSVDRLSYYVSVGDQGRIGQVGDLFNYDTKSITVNAITANYKVYQSNVSKVNNSPMDLRTFYPTTGGIMGYGTVIRDKQTTTNGNTTVTITAMAGVQINKIVTFLRGGQEVTDILASPAVPTGADVSYDATTGTFTVDASNPFVGEDVTYVFLT